MAPRAQAEDAKPAPLAGLLPANAGDNDIVAQQQAQIKRLRLAAAQRADAEARSAATARDERTLRETSYDRLLSETDRMAKAAEANLSFGAAALERLNMQMPDLSPAAPGDEPLTLDTLQGLLDESNAARHGLKVALDHYADWWLQRFFRLLALVAGVIVLAFILTRIGAGLGRSMVDLYGRLRDVLIAIEPPWAGQALWILALVGSVALLALAIVGLARWVNRRFFDTESKRSAMHQRIDASRAELVKRVFVTDEQVMTKYFWGRMFVMVKFAIHHKTSS
jgi:hypothetical protein